jgi:hypothetical protein
MDSNTPLTYTRYRYNSLEGFAAILLHKHVSKIIAKTSRLLYVMADHIIFVLHVRSSETDSVAGDSTVTEGKTIF